MADVRELPPRICANCGKEIYISAPDLWVYKKVTGKKTTYWCSWKCLREAEREREEMKLKNDGTPAKKPGRKPKIETPEGTLADAMKGMQDATEEFFGKCVDMGLKVETPESPVKGPVTVDELRVMMDEQSSFNDRCTVSAVRIDDIGEFYFDKKYNAIDWRTLEGDEVSLSPAGWKQMVGDLPRIMNKLGVEV